MSKKYKKLLIQYWDLNDAKSANSWDMKLAAQEHILGPKVDKAYDKLNKLAAKLDQDKNTDHSGEDIVLHRRRK